MAIESKAEVAVDSLSEGEALEIFSLFGFQAESAERLYGGYASSNFRVTGRREGEDQSRTLLLKINYYGLSVEDAQYQLFVMSHLREVGFPTNYPHATQAGEMLVEHGGRKAMLLDFIAGATPGDKILAADASKTARLLGDLGRTLAQLHQVTWPSDKQLRDIRCGYPVCNTGDLLKGDVVCELEADERVAGHPFVAYVSEKLPWLRELYAQELPWGVIHGDAFLDNTLFEDGPVDSGECRLLALVDWEDSCVGPLALDLAVCASACCFTASNELIGDRLDALFSAYESLRPLSAEERASFTDLMAAAALACAFYRFGEFNVRQPDSDPKAKDSYRIMYERAQRLEAGDVRALLTERGLAR